MATARDEHAKQADTQGFTNDTDLMRPDFDEPRTRMTSQGEIPPVQEGFAAEGPTASERAFGSYVVVTASTLNVRSSPSTESKANIVGKLHRGAKVEQRGREGDWIKINFHGGTAYVHGDYVAPIDTRPSAEASAEAMKDFREVNGDDLMQPEAGVGKPPSKEAMADVMNDFREVNGDIGRGKPPGPELQAEIMQMFREVNGDPAPRKPVSDDILADLE